MIIVDDHPVFRDALTGFLRTKPGLQIVGATASIRETLALLEHRKADLLLVDLSLEDGSGIELVRAVRRARTNTRILIVTAFRDEFWAAEALAVGVNGYFLKEQPTADLFTAIETVVRGETYISPRIALRSPHDKSHRTEDELVARLSRRELEVFHLVVTGSGNKEIARRLFISAKTVDTHRVHINKKLGVQKSTGMIRFAVAHGIAIAPTASDLVPPSGAIR